MELGAFVSLLSRNEGTIRAFISLLSLEIKRVH